MQTFLDCLTDQCKRYQLPAELVIVEWNPPADCPRLADALKWTNNRNCSIRIVEVPPKVHRQFAHSDIVRLYQMIAKNVGIRRAKGSFIVATNVDIVFSEELMAFLASRRLREDCMYRVDRFDVPSDLPSELPVHQLLEFCRGNVIRIHTRWGSTNAKTGKYYEGSSPWKAIITDIGMTLAGRKREKRLHTNASGDFTLLSQAAWFKIRGYSELHTLAMNIDGLGCQTAYFSGLRERVLSRPMQIYHIEHSTSSAWKNEGDGASRARTDSGAPRLSYAEYRELAMRMRRERRAILLNGDGWGLRDRQLPEIIIC